MNQFEVGLKQPNVFQISPQSGSHSWDKEKIQEDGEVLLKIQKFSLTANNISYAAAGRAKGLEYFKHFPASEPSKWGIIPVWGLALVEQSTTEGLQPGDMIYGYFPMASSVVLKPSKVTNKGSFVDLTPARSTLPEIYLSYQLTKFDSFYHSSWDNEMILLRPLYITGFLLADFLSWHSFFAAENVLITSASSKTSLSLAFELRQLKKSNKSIIGITSKKNLQFTKSLGIYDDLITYDSLQSVPLKSSVIVDMAGNQKVIEKLHSHLATGDSTLLKYSCSVGRSHWDQFRKSTFKDPQPTFFFAGQWVAQRSSELGSTKKLMELITNAWVHFVPWSKKWLETPCFFGPEAVSRAYQQLLDGTVSPNSGIIAGMTPENSPQSKL